MIRTTLTCLAALSVAGAAFAQAVPQVPPVSTTSSDMPTTQVTPTPDAPGTAAMLRAKGEAYSRAPDSEQNPAEVATTARLNTEVAAGNAAAAQAETAAVVDYKSELSADASAAATADAQYDAEMQAIMEARANYDRARTTWEGLIAACEASGRTDCRVNDR